VLAGCAPSPWALTGVGAGCAKLPGTRSTGPSSHKKGRAELSLTENTFALGDAKYVPIACRKYFVEVSATPFAEIFVWTGFLCHDANAGAVLPDLADVALYEKAGRLVGNIGREDGLDVCRFFENRLNFLVEGRRARVVVEAANAANGLVLLLGVVIVVGCFNCLYFCRNSVALISLSTGPTPSAKCVIGHDCVFGGL